MVMLNHTGEEANAKIVYYGPGLSGKTTNLDTIHKKMPAEAKGKMVSMKTRTDRTLFFDFLPIEFGEIAGYPTRFLMYTVPGQVYYNATRKLVLGGADAVVFVADSSRAKLQENLESLSNLEDNLNEHGLSLDTIPWVMQYNKRDVSDAMSVPELEEQLNLLGVPAVEATANTGGGVYETFEAIAGLLYEDLRRRLEGGEVVSRMDAAGDPAVPAPPSTAAKLAAGKEESYDNAVDDALREFDTAAGSAGKSGVQAAGSPSSQDAAKLAASAQNLAVEERVPHEDSPMFEDDGQGELDSELGRTLDLEDTGNGARDADGEGREDFITDPMGSRSENSGPPAGKSRPSGSGSYKASLPPRTGSGADHSGERELEADSHQTLESASAEVTLDVSTEPEPTEAASRLKREPARVEPPVHPASVPVPVPEPPKIPVVEPVEPVNTEVEVEIPPQRARADAEIETFSEPVAPRAAPKNTVEPSADAAPDVAVEVALHETDVVEVTVPVVITRSQAQSSIPVRLLLEIDVVDD